MATTTADQLAEATSLREAARQCRIRSLESFEHCDTDGCVSQWAADSMAQLHCAQAEILENGGEATFPALFDLDGNMIANAREVHTRYGWAWIITDTDGTLWFNPSQAQDETRRIAADRRKGYYVGLINAPARATHRSNGGMWVNVHVYRTTEGTEGVTVIDNGK